MSQQRNRTRFDVRDTAATHPCGRCTSEANRSTEHGHRRVLVVDDNSDSADTLVILLQSFGCDARAVYSGEEVLQVAHEYEPDIVILDIGLPQMSGYGVARCLTTHRCTARLIALSGYGQEEDCAQSAAAGFDAHLAKPADIETLMQIISEGVRRI